MGLCFSFGIFIPAFYHPVEGGCRIKRAFQQLDRGYLLGCFYNFKLFKLDRSIPSNLSKNTSRWYVYVYIYLESVLERGQTSEQRAIGREIYRNALEKDNHLGSIPPVCLALSVRDPRFVMANPPAEGNFLKLPRPTVVHYRKRCAPVRRCTGICTFIVALIIHGVAQFLISRRLPLIDAALAPPRGSNLHTERKGKVLTHDTLLPNKQQNPIARHNGAVFFLLLSFPARHRATLCLFLSSFPSPSRLHKEANKSTTMRR